jgi:sugar/nucleoside kinase (ribokinase family)
LRIYGDSQSSSQIGNLSKLINFDVLFPTEREARLAIGSKDEGLEKVAMDLMRLTKVKNLILKLGSDGFIVYETKADGYINREHFPALCVNPVDVTGAGDSLMSAIAFYYSSGISLMESSAIGAYVASLAVQNLGNEPIKIEKLKNLLAS